MVDMDKLVSFCKQRGFIFPGSEIYGGLSNSWDYGPLGVELKNNIKQEWWKRFVRSRGDMVGIDAALIMNPKVWEASGHIGNFTDPLIECKKCHQRFRQDQPETHTKGCEGDFTESRMFNLMFKTTIGALEDASGVAYLRPETAQAMFVDFKNVVDSSRKRIPFGIAQIGKAFRNEITPGNYIFRTREFEQMEIEYFIREDEWETQFDYWLSQMKEWMTFLGLSEKHIHYRDIPAEERAHYSKKTIDIDFEFPFGVKELYGIAYRTDFDLLQHQSASGQDIRYTDPASGEKFVPHVIEPTFGVDRSLLAMLVEHYHEEEVPTSKDGETDVRVVLKLPKILAPVKVAVLPLSKKPELENVAKDIADSLRKEYAVMYDETQSIGRRYRRQDEIGTPYCVTVDFDSLEDHAVTVRDRDTMKQERIVISDLMDFFKEKFSS
ncbi:MAG: glycine--tRNA ligase [bacterium]|nr:glycine--tRNA ligase [bacterium]